MTKDIKTNQFPFVYFLVLLSTLPVMDDGGSFYKKVITEVSWVENSLLFLGVTAISISFIR